MLSYIRSFIIHSCLALARPISHCTMACVCSLGWKKIDKIHWEKLQNMISMYTEHIRSVHWMYTEGMFNMHLGPMCRGGKGMDKTFRLSVDFLFLHFVILRVFIYHPSGFHWVSEHFYSSMIILIPYICPSLSGLMWLLLYLKSVLQLHQCPEWPLCVWVHGRVQWLMAASMSRDQTKIDDQSPSLVLMHSLWLTTLLVCSNKCSLPTLG